MTTSTSNPPPLDHHVDRYDRLGATKLSDYITCASSNATKVVTATEKKQNQSKCRLFSIPLELRMEIYSYVFVAKEPVSRDDKMTLVEAQSAKPASDLLLTCQIIFEEAHSTFEIARTDFWTNTVFYIHLDGTPTWESLNPGKPNMTSLAKDSINELHERELQRIQEVVFTATIGNKGRKWNVSSCCRQFRGVHKFDWTTGIGTSGNLSKYLSLRTCDKPDKRANLLRKMALAPGFYDYL